MTPIVLVHKSTSDSWLRLYNNQLSGMEASSYPYASSLQTGSSFSSLQKYFGAHTTEVYEPS